MRILIIEDDEQISENIHDMLESKGFAADTADSAHNGLGKLADNPYDLIILDWMLPDMDGPEVCSVIRKQAISLPILMLTARSDLSDRLTGLEIGADDYLPKPFEPRELLLRIGGILRRAMPAPQPVVEAVKFGDFHFHLARLELKKGEEVVRLTDREKEMLRVLAVKPGETVPRYDLAAPGGDINERTVDVQVNRLRRKIEIDPANPLHLQTVRGIGYRLIATP